MALNEGLYRALEAVFGEVLIENSGEQAELELHNGRWYMSDGGRRGEQYRVNCPFCSDSDHHLYMSYLTMSTPASGGQTGMPMGLIGLCFRRDCLSRRRNRERLERMIHVGFATAGIEPGLLDVDASPGFADDPDDPEDVRPDLSCDASLEGIRSWSPGYSPINDASPEDILRYVFHDRSLYPRDVREMSIGWGTVYSPKSGLPLPGGHRWIQFPIIQDGKLQGLQARCVGRPEGNMGKYWFHPGTNKRGLLYNLDRARKIGCLVLCEGVIDALHVGAAGVCCFGHTPSLLQRRLLARYAECLILLPDTDVHEDLDTIARAKALAADYNMGAAFQRGAHVVVLPEKDAGDMARQDIWECILSQLDEPIQDYILNRVLDRL